MSNHITKPYIKNIESVDDDCFGLNEFGSVSSNLLTGNIVQDESINTYGSIGIAFILGTHSATTILPTDAIGPSFGSNVNSVYTMKSGVVLGRTDTIDSTGTVLVSMRSLIFEE